MTRNQIDALRNQEIERHNRVQENLDKVMRPIEAATNAIGSIGSIAKGFGAWRNAGKSGSTTNNSTVNGTHYHFHGNPGRKYFPGNNKGGK